MTRYVILHRPETKIAGEIETHSALAALRKAGEKWGAGRYVAVPVSNWKERDVKVETSTLVTVAGEETEPNLKAWAGEKTST